MYKTHLPFLFSLQFHAFWSWKCTHAKTEGIYVRLNVTLSNFFCQVNTNTFIFEFCKIWRNLFCMEKACMVSHHFLPVVYALEARHGCFSWCLACLRLVTLRPWWGLALERAFGKGSVSLPVLEVAVGLATSPLTLYLLGQRCVEVVGEALFAYRIQVWTVLPVEDILQWVMGPSCGLLGLGGHK